MTPELFLLIFSTIAKSVPFIESLFGGGNGATKKAAVLGIVQNVATTAGGLVAANNPTYVPIMNVAGQLIDMTVASHKAMTVAQATPVPTPVTSGTISIVAAKSNVAE
jgi:hypothetical protein